MARLPRLLERRGTTEVGGSPAPREKSLKWKSSEVGDGTRVGRPQKLGGGGVSKCVKEGDPLGWRRRSPSTPTVVTFGSMEGGGV